MIDYGALAGLPPLWRPQGHGLECFHGAIGGGVRDLCITLPTGGGKTRMMGEITAWARERRWATAIFTDKKILTGQATNLLSSFGLDHGVMAAGYESHLLESAQVCSLQTLDRRLDAGRWALPRCKIAMIDEGHRFLGPRAQRVIRALRDAGAIIVYITATPVGMGAVCKTLIVAGTKAELRSIGALVPCKVFAPDEPDLIGVKKIRRDDATAEDVEPDSADILRVSDRAAGKKLMETIVFGDVFMYWRKLNPRQLPSIMFAPGIPESKWFVQEWRRLGVNAEHIDGTTTEAERERIFRGSLDGSIPVVCSQGVLREGVDMPWLYHGILCQPCHKFSTYTQIVGRLLRAFKGKDHAILQDHAGAWWRHGSPNEDHRWTLNSTDKEIELSARAAFQQGETQPIRCPMCSGLRRMGPICPHCGFQHEKSVRVVRMTGGQLRSVEGNAIPPEQKKKAKAASADRQWKSCLFACARSKTPKTLKQVAGYYYKKHGEWLPEEIMRTLPDRDSSDWNRHAIEVFPWLKKFAGKRGL